MKILFSDDVPPERLEAAQEILDVLHVLNAEEPQAGQALFQACVQQAIKELYFFHVEHFVPPPSAPHLWLQKVRVCDEPQALSDHSDDDAADNEDSIDEDTM